MSLPWFPFPSMGEGQGGGANAATVPPIPTFPRAGGKGHSPS